MYLTDSMFTFFFTLVNRHMSRLCYRHDVCPSVCLSITLVDCDHIVQQKVEWAYDRIGLCLSYLHAEADLNRSIL